MCGRFSNAQPRDQYTATVYDQLYHPPRHTTDKASSKGGPSQSKNKSVSNEKNVDSVDSSLPFHSSLQEEDYYPSFNISPSTRVPIVRLENAIPLPPHGDSPRSGGKSDNMKDNALVIQPMRWGLLPAHTTSIPHGPDALRTINARDDSVLSGQSMWTPLLRKGKRCVVFAQGFYEWLKKSDSSRVAHFVGMLDIGKGRTDVDGKQRALMPMAGLYERCVIDEQEMYSFTIITTESNKQLNFLHDRMPVILPDTLAIMTWLGARHASSREVCSLLKPYDAGDLEVYTVPREVGKVGNNDKSFILPVSSRKDGIAAAFGRAKKVEKDTNSETHAPLTEEVKAVETKRKRDQEDQEKVDEDLARKLQKQEEQASEKVKQDEVERDVKVAEQLQENEGVAKGKASNTPKCDNAVMKEEEEKSKEKTEAKGNHLEPSSKFSPDPYNPPISPDRPQGGYSTAEHGNPETRGHIPHRKLAASPTKSAKLQEAAKGTKDIRNFFGGK